MPSILRAFTPVYAAKVLLSPYNKKGFMILGSVFLATTGAEALYSDMGHVGKSNIYFSWPFVKACLLINYMGQGAWIVRNSADKGLAAIPDLNPFFQMLPPWLRPVAIILGAAAAIIASQALITGSYTLVSEAIHIDLMPHLEVRYPSDTKGQIYIGAVNTILWIGCSCVVLYFRSSSRMEAAYGLAITITMLMTTLLLAVYLWKIKKKPGLAIPMLIAFGAIESVFFISSLGKFAIGGYVTVFIALILFLIMVVWYKGTEIENRYGVKLRMRDYIGSLRELHDSEDIPLVADNLVFLENSADMELIDRDVLYSILDKDQKRAKAYWFIGVNMLDEPYARNYQVETFGTDFIFSVRVNLGFKIEPAINVLLRQIVADLMKSGELPPQDKRFSIYGKSNVGSFKFCIIRKEVPMHSSLSKADELVLRVKYTIRTLAGSRASWYGLGTSVQIKEQVPLVVSGASPSEPRTRM
jgi:KUP system potassium uptake protein